MPRLVRHSELFPGDGPALPTGLFLSARDLQDPRKVGELMERLRVAAETDGLVEVFDDGEIEPPLPAAPPRPGPCTFLGADLRTEDCPSCTGTVRIKIYACSHPDHEDTTIMGCRSCPDYEAREA
jgi:hypothetical protein